jgi:signal peptidase I
MKNWIRQNRGLLAFFLLFSLFRTAVADWNPIPTGSMRPTLLEGDVVFVNRLAFDLKLPLTDKIILHLGEPRRGDIVTFSSPKDGTRLIKRLIAVPGDIITMHNKRLTINGQEASYTLLETVPEPIAETVIVPAQHLRELTAQGQRRIQWLPGMQARDNFGPLVIPKDHYLMLGDNRDDSADSRYFGLVDRHLLIGRAVRILVSADIKGSWLPRFDRVGQRLD